MRPHLNGQNQTCYRFSSLNAPTTPHIPPGNRARGMVRWDWRCCHALGVESGEWGGEGGGLASGGWVSRGGQFYVFNSVFPCLVWFRLGLWST